MKPLFCVRARLVSARSLLPFAVLALLPLARAQVPDAAFAPNCNAEVFALVVQPDGKILLGGNFTSVGNTARNHLARLNADGSLDSSFNPAPNGTASTIRLQPDGKILVGGVFTTIAGANRSRIARLNADGSLDASFNASADSRTVENLTLQPDGKILAGGLFTQIDGVARAGFARLNADGSLDTSFDAAITGTGLASTLAVETIAVQPDGKIIIGGNFSSVAGKVRNNLARLNADGSLDEAFNPDASSSVLGLALQLDGRILVGGGFSRMGSSARNNLARLQADGTVDPLFITSADSSVYRIAPQYDGKMIVAGLFTSIAGVPRSRLARLNPDGSLDPSFAADVTGSLGGSTPSIYAIAVPAVGQVVIGGAFNAVLGQTRNGAARLTTSLPTIVTPPASIAANAGSSVTFSVTATGDDLRYQWKKAGVAIPGATNPVYTIPVVIAADMGFYTVAVSSGATESESLPVSLTVTTPGATSRIINVSTRGLVLPGDALTPGFVLRGAGAKRLVVRAIGPTLAQFGVGGTLGNPRLDVIPLGSATALVSNNDWAANSDLPSLVAATAATGAFALNANSHDAAALATLSATGSSGYTARVTGPDATATGLALAEIYDADPANSPVQIVNVSTRGFVGTGANALVPGFVIGGSAPKQLLIRAVGPGLAIFNVPGLLADPQLAVIPLGQSAAIASNDNWGGSAALSAAAATVGAFALPADSKDAVVLVRLPPGGYTVVVSGVGGTTGNALVEIYDVP